MRKSDLHFINDTLKMQRLFYEPSMHKTAQDGMSEIMSKIEGAVGKIYDPDKPVESVLAFLGPGILWMFGFRWMAVIYEVAAALGFNWNEAFNSIKEKLRPMLNSMTEGEKKDTEDVKRIVEESVNTAFSGQANPEQLQEVAEKYSSINNLFFIKKLAYHYEKSPFPKEQIEKFLNSIVGNRMRKGVLGFIITVLSWIISAVLISAGFGLIGTTASKILGINRKEKSEQGQPNQTDKPAVSKTPQTNIELHPDPNADPSYSTITYNDDNHVWLMNININEIKNSLIKWAQEIYPQLDDLNAFNASSAFNNTLKMFQNRNKTSQQVDIIAVPTFHSIREIVDSFAHDVAAHMQPNNYA